MTDYHDADEEAPATPPRALPLRLTDNQLRATMACDVVQLGTGVEVTPLAIARKSRPALVASLLEHGAIDDVFTAAWLGDLPALRGHLARNPDLVHAIDPADDFQEVSPLCHAVCGGSIDAVKLLLERGAEVKRHNGKLLTLAVVGEHETLSLDGRGGRVSAVLFAPRDLRLYSAGRDGVVKLWDGSTAAPAE